MLLPVAGAGNTGFCSSFLPSAQLNGTTQHGYAYLLPKRSTPTPTDFDLKPLSVTARPIRPIAANIPVVADFDSSDELTVNRAFLST